MRWAAPVGLAAGLLLGSGPAIAAEEGWSLELSAPGLRVVALPRDGRTLLAVLTEDEVVLLRPETGSVVARTAIQASDLLVVESGGGQDLLTCGAGGIALLPGGAGEPRTLSDAGCVRLAGVRWPEGPLVVSVDERVVFWRLREEGLAKVGDGERPAGEPLLATEGPRLAIAARGGHEVVEIAPFGRSVFAAGGGVGGLEAGPGGWTWSLPEEGRLVDVTRREVPTGEGPTGLRSGDVDGDGRADLVVRYADRPELGLLRAGAVEVEAMPLDVPVADVLLADLDDDRCDEIVLLAAGLPTLTVLDPPCGPVAEAEAGMQPPREEGTLVLDRRHPPRLRAVVGERVRVRLAHPRGEDVTFAARGAPPGLVVGADGWLVYTPEPQHVGEWRISVRMAGGSTLVEMGEVVLEVVASDRGPPSTGDPWAEDR